MSESTYCGLELDVIQTDDASITVRIRGELDLSTSAQLETELLRLIHRDMSRRLVLDVSGLTFLDSTGLRALWRTRQSAQESGAQLFLNDPSAAVMRVLKTTKLDKVFSMLDGSTDLDVPPGTR